MKTPKHPRMPSIKMFPVVARLCWFIAAFVCLAGCTTLEPSARRIYSSAGLKDGDVLFQDSNSEQSEHIRAITDSPYCHVGIYLKGSVYHAGSSVGRVGFKEWVGTDKGFGEACRLRPGGLTAGEADQLQAALVKFNDKTYDALFREGREKMYCSEYVYYAYKDAFGLETGRWQKFAEFPFTSEGRQLLEKRYKDDNRKFDDQARVISPEALRHGPLQKAKL